MGLEHFDFLKVRRGRSPWDRDNPCAERVSTPVDRKRSKEPSDNERPAGTLDELDLRARALERDGANATPTRGRDEGPHDATPSAHDSLQHELDICERLLEDCRREWGAANQTGTDS